MNPFLALRDHAKEVYDTLSGNERIKERTRGLYDQVVNRGVKPSFPMLLKDPQNVTMDDLIASGFGVMPMAIKAYHGSPHLFDKFDMSKIGTGEGAQAYGHGLYMAESPDVANNYSKTISENQGFTKYKGQTRNQLLGRDREIYDYLTEYGGPRGAADAIESKIKNSSSFDDVDYLINLKNEILNNESSFDNGGNLYETSLQWPDPAREAADPMGPQHYLDWDSNLKEQSKNIQDILNRVAREPEPYGLDNINDKMRMIELKKMFDSPEGIKRLSKLGIPGIRYLDQGSRGAGNGTYNYVVFDDSIPKIVKRNGKPVNTGLPPTQYSKAHETAQRNAALPIEQGGLGLPPDNTAMDRARAMGFDTEAYHGTSGDIKSFNNDFAGLSGIPKTNSDPLLWFTNNADDASFYASMSKPQRLKELQSIKNPSKDQIDELEKLYNKFYSLKSYEIERNQSIYPVLLNMGKDKTVINTNGRPSTFKKQGKDFLKSNNDSMILKNANPGFDSKNNFMNNFDYRENYVLKNPKNIRSRFAAFDPFKRNSADILATGIMGSLLLNELKNRNAQDQPRYR